MNRFTVDKKHVGPASIDITDAADIRHLTRSLRVRPGEDICVSDGEGAAYIATLEKVTSAAARLSIKERLPVRRREEQRVRLTLACAVPKLAHFDDVIDKGTQLAVDAFVPLLTERSLVSLASCLKKMPRWERVRRAAAKQSGALFLPELQRPVSFKDFLPQLAVYDLKILPHLSEQTRSLDEVCAGFDHGRVVALIGPEGDFTPQEVAAAIGAGCAGVSLGPSVLRVDTAAIAVASFIRMRARS